MNGFEHFRKAFPSLRHRKSLIWRLYNYSQCLKHELQAIVQHWTTTQADEHFNIPAWMYRSHGNASRERVLLSSTTICCHFHCTDLKGTEINECNKWTTLTEDHWVLTRGPGSQHSSEILSWLKDANLLPKTEDNIGKSNCLSTSKTLGWIRVYLSASQITSHGRFQNLQLHSIK